MYIHNYQIHNVLNAYRKQLSQSPAKANSAQQAAVASKNTAAPSKNGQPQAIFNQVSTEIIDRIAQFRPKSELDNTTEDQIAPSTPDAGHQRSIDFTYTLIDEQNQKTTQTRSMDSLNALKYRETQKYHASSDMAKDQQPAETLLENEQATPNKWKG